VIKTLEITGYKCFEHIKLNLSNLSIFAGTNSSGKSSAIQAFLLLCNNTPINSSPLNGPWLRLGTFDECRNHIVNAREFIIGIGQGEEMYKLGFGSLEDERQITVVSSLATSKKLEELLDFQNGHVHYLPANRIGPEDSYLRNFDSINYLGSKGEYTIDFLYRNRKNAVQESLIADSASFTLEHQVNYWLTKLFGVSSTIKNLGLTNSLSLELSLDNNKPVRPYHMGSGVSFAIGILISCLSAKQGDIIVVENPEIHLHPRAQSELTEFLCFVANAGVQIILETHSDHVFNGVRKAISNKNISNSDVAVQFFQLEENGLSTSSHILINKHGRVVSHVNGLFDQFDEDLDQILGL